MALPTYNLFDAVDLLKTDSFVPSATANQLVELELHASGGPQTTYGDQISVTTDLGHLPNQPWRFAVFGASSVIKYQPIDRVVLDGGRTGFIESFHLGWVLTDGLHLYTEQRMDAMLDWCDQQYPQGSKTKRVASGGSMGAWGTMTYAMRRPTRFGAVYADRPRWRYAEVGKIGLPRWSSGTSALYDVATSPALAGTTKTAAQHLDLIAYVSDTANKIPFLGWVIGRRDGYSPFSDHVAAVAAMRAANRGFAFAWNDGDHSGPPGINSQIRATYTPDLLQIGMGYPIFSGSSLDQDPAVDLEGGINLGFTWRNLLEDANGWSCEVANVRGAVTVTVRPYSTKFLSSVTPKTITIPAGQYVEVKFGATVQPPVDPPTDPKDPPIVEPVNLMTRTAFSPAALAAYIAAQTAQTRAAALADRFPSGGTLELLTATGVLIRTITVAPWSVGTPVAGAYPAVPGAYTDPATGSGVPAAAVFKAGGEEVFRCSCSTDAAAFYRLKANIVAGVPIIVGSFAVTVLPLAGDPTPTGLFFEAPADIDMVQGGTFPLAQFVVGGVPPYTYSVSEGALQDSVTLNATTGVLSAANTGSTSDDVVAGVKFAVVDSDGAPILEKPKWTVIPQISGKAEAGQVLTCSQGTATGNPTPTKAFKWLRGSTVLSNVATWTATSGDSVVCEATATNSEGVAVVTSAAFGPIAEYVQEPIKSAPVWTTQPAIYGGTTAQSLLTCSAGIVTGVPTPTRAYKWKRGATVLGTESTLAATEGTAVVCEVTATNSEGSAVATTAAFGPITAYVPPVAGALPKFGVTSLAGGSNLPFTYGHVFKQGDVAAGKFIDSDLTDWQAFPTTTWPDGSVRHAIISGRATCTANVKKLVTMSASATNRTGAAISLATLKSAVTLLSVKADKLQDISFGAAPQNIRTAVWCGANRTPETITITCTNGGVISNIVATAISDWAAGWFNIDFTVSGGAVEHARHDLYVVVKPSGTTSTVTARFYGYYRAAGGCEWDGTRDTNPNTAHTTDFPVVFDPVRPTAANTLGSPQVSWSGADFDVPFRTVCTGPIMSNWIFRKQITTTSNHLWAFVDVRLYKGGAIEVLPWIENAPLNPGVTTNGNRRYQATWTVRLNGADIFSEFVKVWPKSRVVLLRNTNTGYKHWSYWSGIADPQIAPGHDTVYLRASKMVPNYNWPASNAQLDSYPKAGFAPSVLTHGGAMPSADHIAWVGLLPPWAAAYVDTDADVRAFDATMRQGFESGCWPVHMRDETTGEAIKFSDYPDISVHEQGRPLLSALTGRTGSGQDLNADITTKSKTVPDKAHQPSLNYLPWLLTGRNWFIDEMCFWMSWSYWATNFSYRKNANFLWHQDEIRADARNLTQHAQAWASLPQFPEEHWARAQIKNTIEYNIDFYWQRATGVSYSGGFVNDIGVLIIGGPPSTYGSVNGSTCFLEAGWMISHFMSAWGMTVDLDLPISGGSSTKLQTMLHYQYKYIVGMCGPDAPGYHSYRWLATYNCPLGEDGKRVPPLPWYSFAEMDAAEDRWLFRYGPLPPGTTMHINEYGANQKKVTSTDWGNTSHLMYHYNALCYAVDHGAVGAEAAWKRISESETWQTQPPRHSGFGIFPRSKQ